jgi:serine/threonine protein kinase
MPITLEQFVQQLGEISLFEGEELSSLRADSQGTGVEQIARDLVKQKKLTAFQAQQLYSGKGKSLLLGNYLLQDKIGQGGMGLVFKALHRRMKRTVALKVLSPSVCKNKSLVARFQREVQAAARLEHPHIVHAFDADEAAGTYFLVMQYVEGKDLSTIVKSKGALPLEQAVNCVLHAALGLEYAHEQGLIHRDVKPANLLLDSTGTVKILDMGLARFEDATQGQAELTNTGAVMGTVDYMAPEQALSTKSADARSDIYSLGITLWYLATGRPAYSGESLMARMLAHRETPIPSLVEELRPKSAGAPVPGLLTTLDGVFRKMVAKKPEDRYQSMSDVVDALESCLRGEAPVAPLMAAAALEDNKFGDFLAGMSNSDPALPSAAAQAVGVAMPVFGAEFEPTQASTSPSAQTDAQTLSSPSAVRLRRRTAWWENRTVQLVGGALALVLVVAGVLFRPRSREELTAPAENIVATVTASSDASTNDAGNTSAANDTSNDATNMPNFFGNKGASNRATPSKDGWYNLFDGRSLTGWTPMGDNGWRADKGVLIGEAAEKSSGWLMSNEEFGDFELELDFKLASGTDSGVYLRAWPTGNLNGSEFVEVQLLDDGPPTKAKPKSNNKTGSIIGKAVPRPAAQAPAETWNRLNVWLQSQRAKVRVNDVQVVDYNQVTRRDPGRIGLQLSSARVEFRNIRVRPLVP